MLALWPDPRGHRPRPYAASMSDLSRFPTGATHGVRVSFYTPHPCPPGRLGARRRDARAASRPRTPDSRPRLSTLAEQFLSPPARGCRLLQPHMTERRDHHAGARLVHLPTIRNKHGAQSAMGDVVGHAPTRLQFSEIGPGTGNIVAMAASKGPPDDRAKRQLRCQLERRCAAFRLDPAPVSFERNNSETDPRR